MTYDIRADRHGSGAATRQSPALEAQRLTSAQVSDTTDLAIYAKALRVWNGTGQPVKLMVTPLTAAADTAAAAVPITVAAGVAAYEPISVRRIWATGSTGLVAGLAAGTVEVLLLTV